jgi:DNA topoisomerase IA
MQEKLKQLELLVMQSLARQKDLQGENASLKARLRNLENGVDKLKETEAELREIKEWKKNAQAVLRRLSGRLEKEIAKAQEEEKKII